MNLTLVWNSLLMSLNIHNHPEVHFQRMGTLVFSFFFFFCERKQSFDEVPPKC